MGAAISISTPIFYIHPFFAIYTLQLSRHTQLGILRC